MFHKEKLRVCKNHFQVEIHYRNIKIRKSNRNFFKILFHFIGGAPKFTIITKELMVEIICSNTTNGFSKDTLQKYENRSLSQKSEGKALARKGKWLEAEEATKPPRILVEGNHRNDDDWNFQWKKEKYHLGQI